MSHKKAGGSTSLGRDSQGQRLGAKKYGGETVKAGNIIVRQRGTTIHPADNCRKGSDDTIFSTADGKVKFFSRKVRNFTSKLVKRTFVSVLTK